MLDLLILKGLIIDGTGNPGFYAGVGIEDNKIRILRGDLSLVEAKRTIDASGMIVCPGFIDVHAHSGLVILAEPKHEAKVRQGVTTELIGVDGNSYAPFFDRDDFLRFVEMNAGLDGNPDLSQEWASVAEYLMCFDMNLVLYLPSKKKTFWKISKQEISRGRNDVRRFWTREKFQLEISLEKT